jgi:HlyD family secretion protein
VLGDELKPGESLVVREIGAKKDKGSGFSLRMM